MYKPVKYLKFMEPQIRMISFSVSLQQKSHYESLGITPKATQSDIKSAYYKLSMIYHPDKNKDSEDAATKFRDITEAYEVLGNVKTRKLYDRGLYISNVGPVAEDIPLKKFYKSRETKSRPPSPFGRSTAYDFDEWSRSHYGATFGRDMRFKEQQRYKKMREKQNAEDVKSEKVILLIGILFLCTAYLFYGKDYDNPDQITVLGGSVIITPKSE